MSEEKYTKKELSKMETCYKYFCSKQGDKRYNTLISLANITSRGWTRKYICECIEHFTGEAPYVKPGLSPLTGDGNLTFMYDNGYFV